MSPAGVWLVIGVQASGKSTVAELLSERFERGVHIRGGQFYRWATRGWAHIEDPPTPEARAHLDLRYRLSSMVADEYARAGFATVVQDNIYDQDVTAWLARVSARPLHLVVLRPDPRVVSEREAERKRATGKTAYRPGSWTIEQLDEGLARVPRIGLWLDTSHQKPEETVNEVWARQSEAVVEV